MICIYHTNDIHSNFSFLKRVYSYLHIHKTENDLYFDSGDYLDLKSDIVQADHGKMAMDLLMDTCLDCMAIGNNEIDLGNEYLCELATMFPIISSNLSDNENKEISAILKSQILCRSGFRFLILAVAPYFSHQNEPEAYNLFFMMGNLKTQNPYQAIALELERYRSKYDYCILLSHSGTKQDEKLLQHFSEIDLILGGHDHQIVSSNCYSQSGGGETLGKITLEIIDGKLCIVENEQLYLPNVENVKFDQVLFDIQRKTDTVLEEELAIYEELEFDPYHENTLMNFVCDALLDHFKGDFAIMHNGIAESGLYRPVSLKSLIKIFPSKLNPTIYEIKGEKILEAIQQSFDNNHIHQDGKGAGFRGTTLGTLSFSHNVKIKNTDVYIGNQKLQPEIKYRIITDDYLQRGTGYPSLKVSDDICEYDKWFIRDLVKHYLLHETIFLQAKECRLLSVY